VDADDPNNGLKTKLAFRKQLSEEGWMEFHIQKRNDWCSLHGIIRGVKCGGG